MKIKVLRGTGASGKSLAAGKTYQVPGDVSEDDAKILIGMSKAEEVVEKEESADPRLAILKSSIEKIAEALPAFSKEDLVFLKDAEEKASKPRKGVIDAIDAELKKRSE